MEPIKSHKPKRRVTLVCGFHYVKLVYRSRLLFAAVFLYVITRVKGMTLPTYFPTLLQWGLILIWLVYAAEMICRFFPSRLESPGCQKQFKRNYHPTEETQPILPARKGTVTVALVWLALNAVIGVLYFTHIIDVGILLLISLFYGVCDMICILFFCPFQMWFMKNRCCTVCRIYNWDFTMMFTPLLFIPHAYTWSLLAMSLGILLRWELTLWLRPERFAENTNACLSCKNCDEKLCLHKRHILRLAKQIKETVKDTVKEKIKK
ncbi:MAG: hypothetical protein IJ363_07085 [Clostridia bacterium]|nr:hypothetical protein [Clostridia bacterium]